MPQFLAKFRYSAENTKKVYSPRLEPIWPKFCEDQNEKNVFTEIWSYFRRFRCGTII